MKFVTKLQKRVLPPTFFIMCILFMAFLSYIWPIKNIIVFPYNLIGIIVLFIGLIISMWGSNKFSRVGTNINTFEEPDKLVTDGLFKYSRNPMYLGFAIALAGLYIILGTISPILIFFIFIVVTDRWYIQFEERMLINKFGKEYNNYRLNTRRWI